MSPSDINVVSLEIALAMRPRPPSPDSAAATQRNTRRENSKQSSTRGEATLTKMPSMPLLGRNNKISSRSQAGPPDPLSASTALKAPVRPPRDARRNGLRLEVRSLIPSLWRVYTHKCVLFTTPDLSLHSHANRLNSTNPQNKALSGGQTAIFQARR